MVVNRQGNSTRRAAVRAPRRAMYNLLILSILAAGIFGCDWLRPEPEPVIVNLSNNEGRSENPRVACGPAGNVVVIWSDWIGSNQELLMVEKSALDSTWPEPVNFTSNAWDSRFPDAKFDAAGRLHVVWQQWTGQGWEILYRCRSAQDEWGVVETIHGSMANHPCLALDAYGSPGVLYSEWTPPSATLIHAQRTSTGGWAQELLPPASGASDAVFCYLTDGRRLALWADHLVPGGDTIRYSVSDSAGRWQGTMPLVGRFGSVAPVVLRDGDTVQAVYSHRRPSGGAQLVVQAYSNGWLAADERISVSLPRCADLGLSREGRLLVALAHSDKLELYERGRRWSRLVQLIVAGGPRPVSLGVTPNGRTVVAWASGDGYLTPIEVYCTELDLTN